MSKERELLKRAVTGLLETRVTDISTKHKFLIDEIEALLDQPEQEPVAWMWTRNYEGGGYTNKVFEFLNDAEEYAKDSKTLKSPDIIRPLYTAPPKREPLSTKQAEDLWETTFKSAVPYYIFDEICGAIEKAHGIGGGE